MKTIKIWLSTIAIILIAGYMVSCKDENVEIIGECPVVESTNPANMATNVPLDQIITATFNVEMDPASFFTEPSFTITGITKTGKVQKPQDGKTSSTTSKPVAKEITLSSKPVKGETTFTFNPEEEKTLLSAKQAQSKSSADTLSAVSTTIEGTVTVSGFTATFTPSEFLESNTNYTATIEAVVTDLMGNVLQTDYIWTFSTTSSTAPAVISTDPRNLATNVALDKTISADFSIAMDPATITSSTFTLKDGTTALAGDVDYSGKTATFNPTNNLELDKAYTATISSDVTDEDGNALASNYVWTFSTGASIIPTVISTDPLNLATNVALDKTISADFSIAMDPATITSSTFTLMDGTTALAGNVNYSGTTATFNPTNNFELYKVYTATISSDVTDEDGTHLGNNYVWTFSTSGTIIPTVISTDPVNLATNVALDKTISAEFSIDMDPATITTSTFTLMDGSTSVSGEVDVSRHNGNF
ncbi:MAG: Ig-like domain-containing protein [Bacteroidales bacterium]|nr:Ig-like domain-containing protein [Bacteroidales bacterium]